MAKMDPWQIMASHNIKYKGEEARVEVIQTINRIPEYFFFIHFPSKDILLSRMNTDLGELWNGTSLTLNEGKELGESIERIIGYTFPKKSSNNPFQYEGDIQVNIERFEIGDATIERAKAPYTIDIFYRITPSSERKVVLVNMFFIDHWEWTIDDPISTSHEDFGLFRDLLEKFEKMYQLGIYC